jgi:DNA-binding IclR family transcriptional regulator
MAVRPSPAVVRAARLLRVIAAEPRTDFTLSELARRLGLSRASCHPLLLGLVGEGLVVRKNPQATYRLGPALLALGEAARSSIDVIDIADTELVRLRNQFGACAMAGSVVAADTVLILSAHPVSHPLGYTVTAGTRIPLKAPTGPIYVAWEAPDVIAAWCDRSDAPLSKARRRKIDQDLAMIRRRGWSATIRRHGRTGAGSSPIPEFRDEDRAADPSTVTGISAPVWDRQGKLACTLALTAFPADLDAGTIVQIAEAVREAADRVTSSVGGQRPGA